MSWKWDGTDTSKVEKHPAGINEVTGLISWTPIQNDTIAEAGDYTLRLIAADQYSFFDTLFVNATVNAVNDTPDVAIIGQDEVISWNEDKPDGQLTKLLNPSKMQKIIQIDPI